MNLRFAVCAIALSMFCRWNLLLADPSSVQPLAPVPAAADRAKAEKMVRDIFKKEFARLDAESRNTLAARLIAEATRAEDLATRYILLQDSSDLSVAAGDVKGAFRALDALASHFAVDGFELKLSALSAASKSSKTPAGAAALVEASLSLIHDAMNAGRFEAAAKLAAQAEAEAKASHDAALVAAVVDAHAAVRDAQMVKPAQEKLQQHPDDPAANLQVGRFLCFVKDDWTAGLPHLSLGSDNVLAKAAKQDLTNPTEAKGQIAVADVWFELSQAPKASMKIPVARRAVYWYRIAIPELNGLTKVAAQKRLWEVARIASPPHLTAYKFSALDEALIFPLSDPSADVLTVTQRAKKLQIVGTKAIDYENRAGHILHHLGKAALFTGADAGGSLRVDVPARPDHTHYFLIMADEQDVPHLEELTLEKSVDYFWEVQEKGDTVTLTVSKDEKAVASISIPSQGFKGYGFGATVRYIGDKADLTVSLD